MHQIRFRPGLHPGPRWGSLRRFPRPPSRLGRGIPLPIPHRLDAFGVSVSAPFVPLSDGLDTRPCKILDLPLPSPPQITPIFTFWSSFIYLELDTLVFVFGTQWLRSGSHNPFVSFAALIISLIRVKLSTSNLIGRLVMASIVVHIR